MKPVTVRKKDGKRSGREHGEHVGNVWQGMVHPAQVDVGKVYKVHDQEEKAKNSKSHLPKLGWESNEPAMSIANLESFLDVNIALHERLHIPCTQFVH